MDHLFMDSKPQEQESLQEERIVKVGNQKLSDDEPIEKPKASKKSQSSGKSFSADLEALFKTSISNEIVNKVQTATTKHNASKGNAKTDSNFVSGLDALIRQTVEESKVKVGVPTPESKKRVTFVVDKDKLGKLKTIAKKEKAYLKDIIGSLVAEYVVEYEENKGEVDFTIVSNKVKNKRS